MSGTGLKRRVEHLENACYTRLSPLERFRLTIEAAARDDFEAADRLWDACPTRAYRQADAAFSGRVRAAELICLIVYADLNYLLGRLRMAEAIGATLLGLIEEAMTDGYFAGVRGAPELRMQSAGSRAILRSRGHRISRRPGKVPTSSGFQRARMGRVRAQASRQAVSKRGREATAKHR